MIANNNDPHWGATFDLGDQDLSKAAGRSVRFEVWDQDNHWDDDLLGECVRELSPGAQEDVCNLQHGRLYIKWRVTCAPNLGGAACMDYESCPHQTTFAEGVCVAPFPARPGGHLEGVWSVGGWGVWAPWQPECRLPFFQVSW